MFLENAGAWSKQPPVIKAEAYEALEAAANCGSDPSCIHEGLCESKFGYGGYMWGLHEVQKL